LFVVVVAVDPRWLLQALTTHYRGLLRRGDGSDVDEDDLWRSTPLHYLEKIFQIPFTLSPLDTSRYEQFVDGLLARPAGSSEPAGPRGAPAAAGGAAVDAETRAEPSSRDLSQTGLTARFEPRSDLTLHLAAPPRSEQVDPLLLDEAERAFLKLLGPPLMTSPRSTKRLVNSYGLLLSLEGPEGRQAMLVPTDDGPPPHRAALTLLATVIARPDASPAFFRHLHEATPAKPWPEFLDLERSRLGRVDLVEVLDQLGEAATSAGLPLPAAVGGFRPWVVKVGRLSFQTGREVVRLG
jgi:hypothetical protein